MNALLQALTFICRIAVGGLFVFSGLIKVNDLHGFAYKLIEYFHVFEQHFGFPGDTFAGMAFTIGTVLAVVEVWLGLWLLLGFKSRFTTLLLFLLIVFFTLLTWYSWKFDAVNDCGCFGDFLKLTPFQSFVKDVVLFVLIGFLFIHTARIKPLFPNRKLQLSLTLALSALVMVIPAVTLTSGPIVDMLGACVGCDFKENTQRVDARKHIPNWFVLADACEGATDEFAGTTLIFVVKDLDKLTHEQGEALGKLTATLKEQGGMQTFVLTATVGQPRRDFAAKYMPQTCLTNQDETLLKTIIRCNQGALLLKEGVVVNKWVCALPDADAVKQAVGK
jgi:uncharacterized membrane protein YphA (DoxX/SURF4 family)